MKGPALVGLGCTQRVGKDTLAARLVAEWGFTRVAFADRVRDLAVACGPEFDGVPLQESLDWHDGDWEPVKADPKVRQFLIALGVGAREVLGPDVWCDAGMREVDRLLAAGKPVVVTDVRFPNEAQAIRDRGGLLIEVRRPGSPEPDEASEPLAGTDWADLTVLNVGSVADLWAVADDLGRFRLDALSMVWQHVLDPTVMDTVLLVPGAEPPAVPAELAERLHEAVDGLAPQHREVVEALFYERVGQRGLAERLGVSRSTVCRRQSAALEALREALEVDGE